MRRKIQNMLQAADAAVVVDVADVVALICYTKKVCYELSAMQRRHFESVC